LAEKINQTSMIIFQSSLWFSLDRTVSWKKWRHFQFDSGCDAQWRSLALKKC